MLMKVSCQTNCSTGTVPAFDFHLFGFSCNTHSPPHHPYLRKPFRLQNYGNFDTHLRSSSKPPGRHPLDREDRRAGRRLSKSPPESCHFVNRVEVKTNSVSRLCCVIWARGRKVGLATTLASIRGRLTHNWTPPAPDTGSSHRCKPRDAEPTLFQPNQPQHQCSEYNMHPNS